LDSLADKINGGTAIARDRRDVSRKVSSNAMNIGFHLGYEFHHAILDPIYALLKEESPCLLTQDADAIIDFKPKILVLADAHYHFFRGRLPGTIIIWVRHGFSDKNHLGRSITGCDFACVSSEWMRDEYIRMGLRPRLGYWVTGFVPMDKVLAHSKHYNLPVLPRNFSPGRATLLYAPTWNNHLSSAEVLGDRWLDTLARTMPGMNVVIKPHPRIPALFPRWMAMWRAAARRNRQVFLVEDSNADVYDYFGSADILLSDVSSVIFYFLALDRPIILVNNPRRFKDRGFFAPLGHEWQWRDMGTQIERGDELPAAIQRCLQSPAEFSRRRATYRRRIFGNLLDGRAAERIADRVKSLMKPSAQDKAWVSLSWNAASAFGEVDTRRALLLRIRSFLTPLARPLGRYPRILFRLRKLFPFT
jgi:hypothetical protein